MRSALVLPALIGFVLAAPTPAPQVLNVAAVDASPAVRVSAPFDTAEDVPVRRQSSPNKHPTKPILLRRNGDCAPRPSGYGPVPIPDTAEAFRNFTTLHALATNAPTPDGYSLAFTNLGGALSASNYMGLHTFRTYNTLRCASKCDQAEGCQAFNIYAERDPSVNPDAVNCPNPRSFTNYRCSLWGAPVAADEATNMGQYRDTFQTAVTSSNGYNKAAAPPSLKGYNGPTELGGAINAPEDAMGHNTYMGYKFFPFNGSQGYDPQTCADACDAQTLFNRQHPASDNTSQSCIFFAAYVISKNALPQGLYCSFYNTTWDRSYATSHGQYRGNNTYTISRPYSYTLADPAPDTSGSSECSTGPVIQNGDFETGQTASGSWSVRGVTGFTNSSVASPNSPGDKGGHLVFEVSLAPSAGSNGTSSLTLIQTMNTCAHGNYSVEMDYRFTQSTGTCSVAINYPFMDTRGSVTSPDNAVGTMAGKWTTVASKFQAGSSHDRFSVLFRCTANAANVVDIDNVVVKPYAGIVY